ncbi:MAG: hypothetical protein LBU28_02575 [Spirochaetaceae bacterium]|jgi:hypothetical protein|nr:hypothetical protein [Spirochaetaceae bacterium]
MGIPNGRGGLCSALALAVVLFSCATGNPYRELDSSVAAGTYEQALGIIVREQEDRPPLYPARDAILLRLDRGMIEHYAEQYGASSADLEEGERLIEAAFTKSLTLEIASYIVNDNTREYAGEDYEDVYLNAFNALNYYHRGDPEGGLVEIRRMNEKLQVLADKYDAGEASVNEYVRESVEDLRVEREPFTFSNSALARYLGTLFYRGAGRADDARIDLEGISRAYAAAPRVYPHRPPASLAGELAVPAGLARLNVIGFAGLSPVKEEEVRLIPLPLPFPNNTAKLALPVLVPRPSAVSRVEAVIDGGPSFQLELLEDMGAVAAETFKAKYSLTFIKTLARTITKTVTSAATAQVMRELDKQGDSLAGLLVGLAGRIATDISERADIRMSRYFPGYAYVGGVNLPPGRYTLTIQYYNRNNRVIASFRMEDVDVRINTLNLAEAVCLQ